MAEAAMEQPLPINRREFLFYIWGASISLVLAGTGGAVLWFAYPRFREGEFGGTFSVNLSALPAQGSAPEDNPAGRFWLVNTDNGVLALYKVCTHLGCLFKWTPSNDRFECPCHGSKFTKTGDWIEGPAPRNLDRFVVQVVDSEGNILTETVTGDANENPEAGDAVALPPDASEIQVDTGQRIEGAQHG